MRPVSVLGLLVMMALAWLLSSQKRIIPWRVVAGGLSLQLVLAFLVLKTTAGHAVVAFLAGGVTDLLGFVDAGAEFVFGKTYRDHPFAFQVLPTIIFFSALMTVLYHFGVMQRVVHLMAVVMRWVLGTSGAETVAVATNIFVGQTESPLAVKPYLAGMTRSELTALMVAGFATVSGGVLAAFVSMGINAEHLLTASVISAPAAFVVAKLMEPETEQPATVGQVALDYRPDTVNVFDALTSGAAQGAKLANNIAAMLLAFLAIIALLDAGAAWLGQQFGEDGWSLSALLGVCFAPLAWLMGVPTSDTLRVGELLGLKMVANELIAYQRLAEWQLGEGQPVLQERSEIIATYALCGFANFASIGVQIGGLGTLAPERRQDLAQLGLRAMIGGTLAAFMTACIAGLLV